MNYFRSYGYKIQNARPPKDAFFENKNVQWEDANQNEVKKKTTIHNYFSGYSPKVVNIQVQKYEDK